MTTQSSLADRRIFALDAEKWAEFQGALHAPMRPLPRLKALLEAPGFFAVAADEHAEKLDL